MQLLYRLAADAVVIVHASYVLFVIGGLLATWVGAVLKRAWARGFWFRALHLSAIAIVVAEERCGVICPLTKWEQQLREQGGQSTYRGEFLANLVHNAMFVDWQPWVFSLVYSLFGAVVLATLLVVPPRWPWRRNRRQSVS